MTNLFLHNIRHNITFSPSIFQSHRTHRYPTGPPLKKSKLLHEQSTAWPLCDLYFLNTARQLSLEHILLLEIERSWPESHFLPNPKQGVSKHIGALSGCRVTPSREKTLKTLKYLSRLSYLPQAPEGLMAGVLCWLQQCDPAPCPEGTYPRHPSASNNPLWCSLWPLPASAVFPYQVIRK